ncbi:hypothetical protein HRF68_18080 [Pseudomonas stutzeri]|nr:hypothetical protein [Stutzerimonas stutzeri]
MSQMLPTQGTSLYQMMSRSIFEKCTEALRNTPTLQTLTLAAAPGLMMFMGGAAIDSMHDINIMTEGGGIGARVTKDGAMAYKEYVASVEILPLWDAVKHGLSGGYESLGNNMAMASVAVTPTLPALAAIAKVAAHVEKFVRDRLGLAKEQDQAQVADYSPAPR